LVVYNGCTVASSSTKTVGLDVVEINWNDRQGFGGKNDDRVFVVEVRKVTGMCKPADKWTLTIQR
jgi:hypothetical protein